MSTITIAEGEIEEYQGVTLPVLRWFLNKNIVASDGDTIGKSSLEEGVFYKEVACLVNGNTVTYEEHTIDSTLDATPADATYTVALFTAAGALIQVLFRRLRVPATPTSTTLEDIVVVNQTPITPAPDSAYTTAQTDALLGNKQPLDSDLTTIAGLTATTDNFMQAKGSAWASRTVAQVNTDLQGTGLIAGASGFRIIPQNSQSAAYPIVAADSGKHILHPTADNNPRTFTIPANTSVAFPIGTAITFINQINTVTIAIDTDTMKLAGPGTTGSRTLAANGVATAIKVAATEWIISGTGLT